MKSNSGFSKVAYGAIGLLLGIAVSAGAFFVIGFINASTADDVITGTWLFDMIDSDASERERAMASLALQGAHLDMKSDGTGMLSYLGTTVGLAWDKGDKDTYQITLDGAVERVPGAPVLDTQSSTMIAHINEYEELFLSNVDDATSCSVFHRSNPDRVVPNALFETYEEFSHSVLADELSKEGSSENDKGASDKNTSRDDTSKSGDFDEAV